MSDVVETDANGMHWVWCPGCDMRHRFDERWQFNGDNEKPTFSPSLLVRWDFGEQREPKVCHSFVRDGEWQYLSDCTHSLAGQTVPMTTMDAAIGESDG